MFLIVAFKQCEFSQNALLHLWLVHAASYKSSSPNEHWLQFNPRCVLIFPAGAWLADCPGASLKETLCLSRCTEVTSLPLSWNPWTMWTTLWQNRKTVGEQSATSSELAFEGILHVVAAADRHVLSRCGVTKMTNPWKKTRWPCWVTESLPHKPSLVKITERFGATFATAGFARLSDGVSNNARKWLLHNLLHHDLRETEMAAKWLGAC